ncbi:hypothetical protein PRZ48_004537 [Zasmidium cellare]|uniref:Uncharacterized protein n=1 Tax=Zasmidium cellare TaxID=395010 RepID=A0ABR0EQ40_ZASCE|nr:hypothetical protein PRZ48_004537 [Zasmidium cellare]
MTDAEDDTAPKGKKCHLLALPRKIRNLIWAEAALEDNGTRLDLTFGDFPPKWMRANHQISKEVLPVWFLVNRFTFELKHDEDLGFLIGIESIVARGLNTNWVDIQVVCHPDYMPDSSIITVWARHIHAGGNWRPVIEESDDVKRNIQRTIVLSTLEQTSLCRGMTWEECEKVLGVTYKSIVKTIDAFTGNPEAA